MTIDIRHVNNLGSSKFRTSAQNDKEQTCYFNYNKKDRAFNRFLAVRKETSANKIIFSIVSLIDKSNRFEDNYYKIGDELREFDNDRIQRKPRNQELRQKDNKQTRTDDSDRRKKQYDRQQRISKKLRFLSR